MTPERWIDIGKLLASIAIPIVLFFIGHKLLGHVEGTKALFLKQSEFEKKWAEKFFDSGQEFMQALERFLALLTDYRETGTNEKRRTELLEEIWRLKVTLQELEIRIKRNVLFATTSGEAVKQAAYDCVSRTSELLASISASGIGNVDCVIDKMHEFSRASRTAHAELLRLGAAKSAGS